MNIQKTILTLLVSFLLSFFNEAVEACSMYKITVDSTTMVGCNQDAWRTTTSIWFENAKNENEYGASFTGSRRVGPNKFVPQSGMNTKGLVFSRLTAYHPIQNIDRSNKKQITNEVDYLSDILHNCQSVEEVKDFIEMHDHSLFIDDVFIYVDKSGDYLIVEPYKLIFGNDPTYVLSNFCPSITSNQNARKQIRYKNGRDYLKAHEPNASLKFCRSVSDTMSVCRNRNGDGTLLTSIWNTQNGLVNLYFYHNYDSTIQYDLTEELSLGDHIISIPEQFPINPEFQRLVDYKTPFNQNYLRIALVLTGGFIMFLSFLYLISYIRKRNIYKYNFIKLIFSGLNVLLFYYLYILATKVNIYYFDAPYKDPSSDLISLSSYIPFVLILSIVPISFYNICFAKNNSHSVLMKTSLISNNLIYIILIFGFGYWGLYDVIN